MSAFDSKNTGRANLFLNDPMLFNVASSLPANLLTGFEELGAFAGSIEARDLARLANQYPPKLNRHDEWGKKRQFVELHPAYHALARRSKHMGLTSSIWENRPDENKVRYQARAIRLFLMAQLENGHLCEITTTSAGIAALIGDVDLYRLWQAALLSRQHDATDRPIERKKGVAFAFALQDAETQIPFARNKCQAKLLNYNQTLARNIYQLSGTKLRVSNPNADAIFVTAELDGEVSCFLVPRFSDNGEYNHINIQYLIDEAGYKSRPIAELSFDKSSAWLVGQASEGNKIVNDIETMVRFDEAVIAAGNLRTSLQFAIEYLRRQADGRMSAVTSRVFADIALDVAAAESFVMRLAQAFDMAAQDRSQAAFARIMTPVAAFWINGLVAPILSEVISQVGAAAYQNGAFLPRFLSDSCVRLLGGKSGNQLVGDIIRSAERAPKLFDEIIGQMGQGIGPAGSRTVEVLRAAAQIALTDDGAARLLAEQLAYAASAAALNKLQITPVSAAFTESRLGGQWRSSYGMLSARHNPGHILQALYPKV